ncbi:MAG: PAS domain S-box protein [Deltaproteobacteria bacterium]|nr:PAS domain S-box protein [Deltaproteobacteria bacterium]
MRHELAIDITDEKRAERALRESEELYRSLFENMLNGFAHCEMVFEEGRPVDFIYLNVNTAFERQTGLRGVVGKKVSEVIPGILESNRDLIEIYGHVAATGAPEQFEIFVPPLDMWFAVSVYSPTQDHFVAVFDVITERKRAEEAIRLQKRQLQALLDNIPDIAWLKDREGRFIAVNEPFGRSCSHRPNELVGKTDLDIWPSELAERNRADDRDVMDSRKRKRVEEPFVDKRAVPVWIETIKTPVLDENGDVIGTAGIARDVTERHEAEEVLQRSERYFRSLLEKAPDKISVLDGRGNYIYLSPSVTRITGYESDELVGTSVFDILHPDDRERSRNLFKKLRTRPRERSVEIAYRIKCKNGRYKDFEGTATNLLSDPDVNAIVFNIRDVTERKRAEEALERNERYFRSLLEKTPGIITVMGANGAVAFQSPSIETITGHAPEEWVGKNGFDFIHPGDVEHTAAVFAELAAEPGRVVSGIQYRVLHKDGSYRNFEATARSLLHDPAVNGIVVNARDITDRKMADAQIRQLSATIEAATVSVAISNPNLKISYVNDTLCKTYGYARDELIGRPMTVLEEGEGSKAIWPILERDGRWSGEILQRRKDGSTFPGLLSIFATRDEVGAPASMVGFVTDISERKAAEEEQLLFRTLINHSSDAFEITDPKTGRFLDVNQMACRMLGYSREELLERTVFDIDPTVRPEDGERFCEFGRNGDAVAIETVHRRKDGSTLPVEISSEHVRLDRDYVVSTVRDVSERKKTEQSLRLFRTLIDHSNDAFEVVDPETARFLDVNETGCRVLGYTREEFLKLSVFDIDPW